MKIEAKKFEEFLKRFNGINNQVILDFQENGLKARSLAPTNISRADVVLNKSAFIEYESIGKIGAQDLNVLQSVVKRFGKEMEIKVTGNLLTLKEPGRKLETELVDVQFIEDCGDLKELEFAETFTVDSEKVKTFLDDADLNKDIAYTIRTAEKVVRFENDGKFKFHYDVEAIEAKGGARTKLGEDFSTLMNNLSGQIKISMGTDFPVKIFEKSDDMIVSYIIAPRVNHEEKEREENGDEE